MDQGFVIGLMQETLRVALLLALPILAAAFVTGMFVTIIEAVTGVQESTLTLLPKAAMVVLVIFLLGGAQLSTMTDYTQRIFQMLPLAAR